MKAKFGFWNWSSPLSLIGSLICNFSEYFNFSLGKFAPIAFGWMIGARGKKVKGGTK